MHALDIAPFPIETKGSSAANWLLLAFDVLINNNGYDGCNETQAPAM
jgi:hypothetical protein